MITLHELNAQAIVKKLGIVERSPRTIWIALEEEYGLGFFRKIVEEEYGLVEDLENMKKKLASDIALDKLEHSMKIE